MSQGGKCLFAAPSSDIMKVRNPKRRSALPRKRPASKQNGRNRRNIFHVMKMPVIGLLPIPVMQLDHRGTVLSISPQWIHEDRCGEGELRKPGMGARFEDCLPRRMAGAVVQVLQGRKKKADLDVEIKTGGRRRWFRLSAVPMGEGAGRGAMVTQTEITREKKASRALRESEHHFRTLADSGTALIWTAGLDKKCNYFNRTWLEFTGRSLEQEKGDGWVQGVHPDDLKGCVETYGESFDRREKFCMMYRLRRSDGEYRWIQDLGSPRYDVDGRFIGYIGHCLDVTELLEANKSMREARDYLENLFSHANSPMVVWDASRRITRFNPAFERMTGFTAAEVMGKPLETLFPEEGRRDTLKFIRQTLKGRRLDLVEISILRRDGEIRTALWSSANIMQEDGVHVKETIAQGTDITERKKLERQFLRAQRMESIGTLAGGIAHDLNNVLQPILITVESLAAAETDPSRREALESVAAGAQRGADLIRQLLGFARGVDIRREDININALLADIGRLVRETFPRSVELVLSADPGLWNVRGEPTLLHQVLLNLCVNARDAMPQGGRLTISGTNLRLDVAEDDVPPRVPAGKYVLVRVEDTGEGMAPEILERVFEPFFTTKGPGRGSGLGLPTALSIVRAHDGVMRVSSVAGRGTCFSVFLPVRAARAGSEVSAIAGTPASGQGQLLLVVDDEELVRRAAERTLKTHGYRVLTAADGREALEVLAREPVELMLTDMVMPGMDGVELVRAVRLRHPVLRIIAVSGFHAGEAGANRLPKGATAFLSKPFRTRPLLETVSRVLSGLKS